VRTILETRPIPRIVPDGVFDAFGWCQSGALEWRAPDGSTLSGGVSSENPPRMAFVMKADVSFLPRELARLHVPGLGLMDEWALAPYGIDDATDELHAHRVPPGDVLWLAADSLAGLFWGLHDWAHFHNHGPFSQRAWTELQCDAAALSWLWSNRTALALDASTWEQARQDVVRIGAARFVEEELAAEIDRAASLLEAARIKRLL
jgi:hypothetical protein